MKNKFFLAITAAALIAMFPSFAQCQKIWTGGVCSLWGLYNNWGRKDAPQYYDVVVIRKGKNFDPEIIYDDASAKKVIIEKGGCLTISGNVLTIGGG